MNCHDCAQIQGIIQEDIETLKNKFIKLNGNVEATNRWQQSVEKIK